MESGALEGKTCLVTGGGGSIGAEIVREAAKMSAEKIVIADIYENGAYDIKCEIGDKVAVEIASVRDREKMDRLFSAYRPEIVIHAAAHKHVPFMEISPEEAVKNNITGTQIVSSLAEKYGAENFVLISTDKAVEPISIMGASKRVCEMMVYDMSLKSARTKFTTVRFGNVLCSNGSVIPLFRRQVKTGVLTVTHPDVTRYFMTTQEAARLVLQSLEIARGGEVFVLDMGESVRILDIAKKVIDEEGLTEKDVKIEFTGLRKGDKLCEKLFYDFEKAEMAEYDKIMRVSGSSVQCLDAEVIRLQKMAIEHDRAGIRDLIIELANRAVRQ